MRKRSVLLIAGACLASLSLAVGSAMADPSSTNTPRNLNGEGSDTTQGVMNALSNGIGSTAGISIGGVLQVGSWDAANPPGTGTITTRSSPAACTNMPRQSGSNNGITALVNDRAAGTHCLSFARSSTNSVANFPNDHLTYIPFATDAVAYAFRGPGASPGGSSINRNASVAFLKTLYTQTGNPGAGTCIANFQPLLPQFGSGTRQFFLQNVLGLGAGADVANYAGPGGLHPCVLDTDSAGHPLLENTGNLLTSDQQVEPYSVSSWIAQTTKAVSDVHGLTLLGNIQSSSGVNTPSLAINSSATGSRPVFNVVPNVLVQNASNSQQVFVNTAPAGSPNTSLLCQQTSTILQLGFLPRSDCGSTTIQTDSGTGTDTVAPNE